MFARTNTGSERSVLAAQASSRARRCRQRSLATYYLDSILEAIGDMRLNLKEKSVIVTGAASNIGRGIALAFAEEGAAVAIADIDIARAQAVADEALARGAAKSLAVKADVSN